MPCMYLQFDEVPQIGFAHHFQMNDYWQNFDDIPDNSFEIVYVKTGNIRISLYEKHYDIPPQSVLVLDHSLPIVLSSIDGVQHKHCTMQVKTKGIIRFSETQSIAPNPQENAMVVPFITLPCPENEEIKKELYAGISTISTLGENGRFPAALSALGILSKLNNMYRQKFYDKGNTASLWDYKIKQYVAEHMNEEIPLAKIAAAIGKSPNYLNSVFKENNGIGIHQYISRERIRLICELMENQSIPFKNACEQVAILDVSYGYRLFKKHTGITPGGFLKGAHFVIE